MRIKITYTTFTSASNPAQYNQGTFYTYDIEGNVDTLLQDYGSSSIGTAQNVMNLNGNRFKRMVYRYDLVSGKVNSVAYQPHEVDAFHHRYTYDAENRLTLAETSTDSVYWDKEARYEYYKHGPLARIIIGDKMVQGLDYAYTLQGWLKGVNSTSLLPVYDMGRDGDTTYQNRYIAKDVYGFGLNYYSGDYAAIGTGVDPFPNVSAYLNTNDRPLFNGNISSMAVNLGPLYENPGGMADTSHWRGPLLYSYRYDQLNRITGMDAYYGLNQATNGWAGLLPTADFRERVSYDGNGNILGYKRNNFGETGLPMDSLHYNYITGTNKLDFIRDSASDAVGGGYDLHNQPGNNYRYDSIGNLIKDSSEKIGAIKWNVYGKITEIDRLTTTAERPTKNIYYYYDAAGHRIGKKVVRGDTSAVSYTWYVRDASGNVMATYTAGIDSTKADSSADLQLNEQHIYGSSRLGILTVNRSVDGNTTGTNNYVTPWTGVHLPYYTGRKQYELSNHLGNVLATITDKKIGVSLASDSSLIDHYEADVETAQDYYPFGMIMPGRMFTAISIPGGTYSGTTQVNGYTLPVDLTISSRTGTTPSTYTATHSIELEEGFESGTNDDVTAYIADTSYAGGGNGEDDGSAIAGTGKYRYGFNGKENDNEVKGIGDQIDYGMRVYDPRVGRFMSVDPLYRKYAWNSVYAYAENDVLRNIDLDGGEKKHYLLVWDEMHEKATLTYSHSEDFTETKTKWTPTWSSWTKTTTTTVKNPRVEYVVHGTVTVPMSADGLFKDDVRAVTWTFATAEEMFGKETARREAAEKGPSYWGPSHEWGYASSDQHWDITLGQMATYGVEAQATKEIYSPNVFRVNSLGRKIMYHYTTAEGESGIVSSQTLNPSTKALNPGDARYGDGQYLTDIVPGTKTPGQLSRSFLRLPWFGKRFTNYVAIDVTGLNIVKGRENVFVIPNSGNLDLRGRTVGSGQVPAATTTSKSVTQTATTH